MNLKNVTEINGIKLTQPERNLLAKLEDAYGWQVFPGAHTTATNAVTGARVTVDPVVGALIEFVQVAYRNYERSGTGKMMVSNKNVSISIFDRVRYIVLRVDGRAFSAILD